MVGVTRCSFRILYHSRCITGLNHHTGSKQKVNVTYKSQRNAFSGK